MDLLNYVVLCQYNLNRFKCRYCMACYKLPPVYTQDSFINRDKDKRALLKLHAITYVEGILGIPMGTNCAPLIVDLFLYCYESHFMAIINKDPSKHHLVWSKQIVGSKLR